MSNERKKFLESLKVNNKIDIKNHPAVLKGRRFVAKTVGKVKELAQKGIRVLKRFGKYITLGLCGIACSLNLAACTPTLENSQGEPNNGIVNTATLNNEEKQQKDPELQRIENIDSIEDIKLDIKRVFIKAYNEKYGTEHTSSEVELYFNSIAGGQVYQVDGKKVTKGSYPAKTRRELENMGEVKVVGGVDNIIQFEVNGQIFSYNISNGDFIHSGNGDLNLNKEIPSENFGEGVIEKAGAAIGTEKWGLDEVSKKTSIIDYREARTKDLKSKNNEKKGFEPGD